MKCNNRKGKEGKCLGHTDTDGDKYNQKQVQVLKNNTRYSRTQVLQRINLGFLSQLKLENYLDIFRNDQKEEKRLRCACGQAYLEVETKSSMKN